MKQVFLASLLMGHFALAQSLTPPPQPTYESCVVRDQACYQRNQQKQDDYNNQLQAYNVMVREQNQIVNQPQTDTASALATASQNIAAKDSMQEAEQKNKKGNTIYKVAAIGCGVAAAVFAVKFATTPCGVTPGFCTPPNLYKSMAFAAFAVLAASQASKHSKSAYAACTSANQISSTQRDCGSDPTVTDTTVTQPQPWPPTGGTTTVFPPNLVDNNGNCIGTAQECQAITDSLPPGTSIRDVQNGLSGFATTGKPLFTVNPDGSITDKNGKKIPASAFSSAKGLQGLGMSAMDAQALLGDLNKTGALAGNANTGSGNTAATGSGVSSGTDLNGSGGFDGGAGGGTVAVKAVDPNGDAKAGEKDINGAGAAGRNGNGGRDVASAEGLVKDFNGELIGVAGDDIFKMMNRRYNQKAAQDSFIGP